MATKLIMTMGIPGSGKSFWAAQQEGFQVVNKDDIRADLTGLGKGWTWSPETEKIDVIPLRDRLIEQALEEGKSVISSDCNFSRAHKVQLEKLARRYGAQFETVRFDTPLALCLERNAARKTGRVPEGAIKAMFYKYVANDPDHWPQSALSAYTPKPVEPDEHLTKAIICDLDGTLALKHRGRGFYEYDTCDQDAVVPHIQRLIRLYHDALQFQIVYLSGREELGRASTEAFLRKYDCPPGPLFMRAEGDGRKDRIVKLELFDAHVRGRYNVEFVLDDRPSVLRMWRELGLPTLACGDGHEF